MGGFKEFAEKGVRYIDVHLILFALLNDLEKIHLEPW